MFSVFNLVQQSISVPAGDSQLSWSFPSPTTVRACLHLCINSAQPPDPDSQWFVQKWSSFCFSSPGILGSGWVWFSWVELSWVECPRRYALSVGSCFFGKKLSTHVCRGMPACHDAFVIIQHTHIVLWWRSDILTVLGIACFTYWQKVTSKNFCLSVERVACSLLMKVNVTQAPNLQISFEWRSR